MKCWHSAPNPGAGPRHAWSLLHAWTGAGLCKKSDGVGLMASAFVDEVLFGFGIELTAAQLALVNKYRAMLGKAALTESPGRRFLDYGANKEGYSQGWTLVQVSAQPERFL